MDFFVRFAVLLALVAAVVASVPAAAQDEGASGYGGSTGYGFDVSHDGYQREGQTGTTNDAPTYVVIEAEEGTTERVDGDTVIVVQEPEPVAATEHAPPAPQTVVVVQPEVQCPGAIWVESYWAYSNGEYVWVDGHCVVERVNYVFVQPRWDFYANVWWFVPGYYRPWSVYVGFGYHRPWHWYPPYYHPHYRGHHPVPVHRSVPRRPTTVQARQPAHHPTRGVVGRPRAGASRVDTVDRARTTAARTTVVHRPPASTVRTGTAVRTGSSVRTGTTIRTGTAVSQPRVNPSRASSVVRRPPSARLPTASVGRPATSRPSASPSRANSVSRPSSGSSRGRSFSRPSAGVSRPSTGSSRPSFRGSSPSFGRGGGFARPSSGGFGGARSVPTARGR